MGLDIELIYSIGFTIRLVKDVIHHKNLYQTTNATELSATTVEDVLSFIDANLVEETQYV